MEKTKLSNVQQQELDYILKVVDRDWASERAFYSACHMRQSSWERFKHGAVSNITRKNWESMMNLLFNDYELMLFRRAKELVIYNYQESLEEAFFDLKKEHARHFMNTGGTARVDSAQDMYVKEEVYLGTRLWIEDVLGNTIRFRLNCSSKDVPSGKRNRLKWFNEKFEEVVSPL